MSANDALFVQKNSRGQFVAQLGANEGDLPDPEKADASETFTSLESLVVMTQAKASETEHGLQIKIDTSNSVIETFKYSRKPFDVDAVQVSPENMDLVASWTGGAVKSDDGGIKYINIDVHRAASDRQMMAYEGDWVLFAGQGFKIYTNAAFKKSFVQTSEEPKLHEIRPRRTFQNRGPKGPKLARNASKESIDALKKVANSLGKPSKKISEVVHAEEVEDTPQSQTVTVYKSTTNGGRVTKEYADQNPDTTYAERVPVNSEEKS